LDNEPSNTLQFHVQAKKGNIAACLFHLHEVHSECLEHLSVVAKPKKAVFAKRSFSEGRLVLVPSSPNITTTIMDAGAETTPVKDAALIPLGVLLKHPRTGQSVAFHISPLTTLPSQKQPGFICPYFFVRVSDDKDTCNMEASTTLVKNFVSVGDKKVGSKSPELSVELPILVNFKRVSPGDELVAYKPCQVTQDVGKADASSKRARKQ
jgi:hypothetical protein